MEISNGINTAVALRAEQAKAPENIADAKAQTALRDQSAVNAAPVRSEGKTVRGTDEALKKAEALLDEAFKSKLPDNAKLSIEIDDDTGKVVYKSIDRETGETIKQYPPKAVLEQLAYYREIAGVSVDKEA